MYGSSPLESAVKKLDPLYEKVHGGYFGVIAGGLGIAVMVAMWALVGLVDPITEFSTWIHNVSGVFTSAGALTEGTNAVFLILTFVTVFFVAFFLLFLIRGCFAGEQHHPGSLWAALIAGFVTIAGFVIVAIANTTTQAMLVTYGAVLLIFGVFFAMLFFNTAEMTNSEFGRFPPLVGYFINLLGAAFLFFLIPQLYAAGDFLKVVATTNPVQYIPTVGATGQTIFAFLTTTGLYYTRYFEWAFALGFFGWMLVTGVYTLWRKKEWAIF